MLRVRKNRRRTLGKFKLHKPEWTDPFPWIPGTHPEKLLFAALVRRGIYFRFQDAFPKADVPISAILQDRNFQPDFLVPEWKIIFDPYGDFAHSQPSAIGTKEKPGSDVWKQVYYETAGYEFIHPWTSDIEKYGPDWMIDQSKRLRLPPMFKLSPEDLCDKTLQGYHLGPFLGAGATSTAKANHARAHPHSLVLRSGQRSINRRPRR